MRKTDLTDVTLQTCCPSPLDNVSQRLHQSAQHKLARYTAESAEDKLEPSVVRFYSDRLYPKTSRDQLRHHYDPKANAFGKHVKRHMLQSMTEHGILAATLHKFGDMAAQRRSTTRQKYKPFELDVVLIEEAGQILESMTCHALAMTSEATRLILIGDHQQLTATCRSIENQADSRDRSLFERLALNGFSDYIMLEVQHRMVPEIAAYPSKAFYKNALRTAVQQSLIPHGFPYASKPAPIVFKNVFGAEERQGTSYCNRKEMAVLVEALKTLVKYNSIKPSDIAIISPYTGQVDLAQQMLPKARIKGVTCLSVDAAQGQEYTIVGISLVRCNKSGDLGFLKDHRRLNVAMTRARQGLIIVGNQDTLLARDETNVWHPFFEHFQAEGWLSGCSTHLKQSASGACADRTTKAKKK